MYLITPPLPSDQRVHTPLASIPPTTTATTSNRQGPNINHQRAGQTLHTTHTKRLKNLLASKTLFLYKPLLHPTSCKRKKTTRISLHPLGAEMGATALTPPCRRGGSTLALLGPAPGGLEGGLVPCPLLLWVGEVRGVGGGVWPGVWPWRWGGPGCGLVVGWPWWPWFWPWWSGVRGP